MKRIGSVLFNVLALGLVGAIFYIESNRVDHILKEGNYVDIIKN